MDRGDGGFREEAGDLDREEVIEDHVGASRSNGYRSENMDRVGAGVLIGVGVHLPDVSSKGRANDRERAAAAAHPQFRADLRRRCRRDLIGGSVEGGKRGKSVAAFNDEGRCLRMD